MGRKIVVTSGKGGVGKTTVTANLGIALAVKGYKVTMVDADVGLNNLDVVMSAEDKIVFDLGDIAEGKCRIKQALIADERLPTLSVLPSARSTPENILSTPIMCGITEELAKTNDFVLIDCPAGIDNGFHRAVSAASEAIVVTTPHISAVRDAFKVISLLSTYKNVGGVALVVNRIDGKLVADGSIMDAKDISELLKCDLKGAIPESRELNVYSLLPKEHEEKNLTQTAYFFLADYVAGTDNKVFNVNSVGFFGRLKRMFRSAN